MRLDNIPVKQNFRIKPFKNYFITDTGHVLNKTSEFILKNCDGKTTVKIICGRVSKKFNVSEKKAELDVLQHFGELETEGLIKV